MNTAQSITITGVIKNAHTLALKDCDYDFIDEIDIPGMPETKENDFLNNYIFSEAQCPQGICITDEYVLITSYSDDKGSLGELMVFDREDGEYLVNTWHGCKQSPGEELPLTGKMYGCAIPTTQLWSASRMNFISLMATANSKQVIDATGVVDVFDVGKQAVMHHILWRQAVDSHS